jgi:hypothetical protein
MPITELTELVRGAALVVRPYTRVTQSGVVLAAYAFDTPVVATQVGDAGGRVGVREREGDVHDQRQPGCRVGALVEPTRRGRGQDHSGPRGRARP